MTAGSVHLRWMLKGLHTLTLWKIHPAALNARGLKGCYCSAPTYVIAICCIHITFRVLFNLICLGGCWCALLISWKMSLVFCVFNISLLLLDSLQCFRPKYFGQIYICILQICILDSCSHPLLTFMWSCLTCSKTKMLISELHWSPSIYFSVEIASVCALYIWLKRFSISELLCYVRLTAHSWHKNKPDVFIEGSRLGLLVHSLFGSF